MMLKTKLHIMLRFFRKMRQALVPENRFGRYFFYAVGEIVLVVIGILIALQINNLNELRKLHNDDFEFLQSLRLEIVQDTTQLSKRISNYNKNNEDIRNAISIFNNSILLTDKEYRQIETAIGKVHWHEIAYKNVERNDINIASGKLNRINTNLNQIYISYLDYRKLNNNLSQKLSESLQNEVEKYIHPNIRFMLTDSLKTSIEFHFEGIKNNRLFQNTFVKSYNYRRVTLNRMESQKQRAKEIIIAIDAILDLTQ